MLRTTLLLCLAGLLAAAAIAIGVWAANGLGEADAEALAKEPEHVKKEGVIFKVGAGTSSMGVQDWIYRHWFAPFARPINASLAFAICYVALWTLVAGWFYRKKIFVKV